MESSPRVSSQEEDLVLRSTKKVKTRDDVDLNQPSKDMDIVLHQESSDAMTNKISYKESLLTPPGPSINHIELDLDDVNEEDPNPEDQWYKDDDPLPKEEKAFDPCPVIPVSKEEFDE
ncbi:hypothetical protein PIB30_093127, partial [Stylosanthes scabra]|nr:hypothetical protein [Stylosanthes scabra]